MDRYTVTCPWCHQHVAIDDRNVMFRHRSGARTRATKKLAPVYQVCAYGGVTVAQAAAGITGSVMKKLTQQANRPW